MTVSLLTAKAMITVTSYKKNRIEPQTNRGNITALSEGVCGGGVEQCGWAVSLTGLDMDLVWLSQKVAYRDWQPPCRKIPCISHKGKLWQVSLGALDHGSVIYYKGARIPEGRYWAHRF